MSSSSPMAAAAAPTRRSPANRRSIGRVPRPLSLRTQSDAIAGEQDADLDLPLTHVRHKSTSTSPQLARLSAGSIQHALEPLFSPTYSTGSAGGGSTSPLSPRHSLEHVRERSASLYSTYGVAQEPRIPAPGYASSITQFDFTRIDYELERARRLGAGLWSTVVLAEPAIPSSQPNKGRLTPPYSPRSSISAKPAAVFAIKLPARGDAAVVLSHEAKVLTHLQCYSGVSQYIVSFFGQDPRNNALVFEAVLGGSLEDLVNRLKHMTDFARHQEVVNLFSSLALDLVTGLEFMHEAGVVHADIKPANVLLDISDHYSLPAPVIRARYIDFSASFVPAYEDNMPMGGGTWDFMAPEQMRVQKDLSKPTFASDVWSLGITLLHIILLGSPYAPACGSNVFMLREAIKSGDPLSFARMDPQLKSRMDACQSYIDVCRLAFHKDRDRRPSASLWKRWLEEQYM